MTLHVLYLAHDLADPAIRRRVLTLKAGGADVTVAGFQRSGNVLSEDAGVTSIQLGRTSDGRFAQRIGAIVQARLALKNRLAGVKRPDVIIARNLETLALAQAASSIFGGGIPFAYECLDIHRLLLDEGLKGRVVREAQRRLAGRASLLITSSPAFVEHFFKPRSGLDLPILLLENKVLQLDPAATSLPLQPRLPEAGRPWRIGWFGALRCRKSLGILFDFARRMDGAVEIVLRGRPAYAEMPNFETQVKDAPHVEFHGSYRNPEELPSIYGDVQFTWAIDFFEEGLNSDWLLPNRLYEGSLYGAIPIAHASTETGRFVAARDLGLTLESVSPDALVSLFRIMTETRYLRLFEKLAAVDRAQWVTDLADCRALVAKLATLGSTSSSPAAVPAVSTLRS